MQLSPDRPCSALATRWHVYIWQWRAGVVPSMPCLLCFLTSSFRVSLLAEQKCCLTAGTLL